jgi:hypothetical protein
LVQPPDAENRTSGGVGGVTGRKSCHPDPIFDLTNAQKMVSAAEQTAPADVKPQLQAAEQDLQNAAAQALQSQGQAAQSQDQQAKAALQNAQKALGQDMAQVQSQSQQDQSQGQTQSQNNNQQQVRAKTSLCRVR